jgi:hypothetical protein
MLRCVLLVIWDRFNHIHLNYRFLNKLLPTTTTTTSTASAAHIHTPPAIHPSVWFIIGILRLLLKYPHKYNKVLLFLFGQSGLKDQVKELHRILQREQSAIVQVRR